MRIRLAVALCALLLMVAPVVTPVEAGEQPASLNALAKRLENAQARLKQLVEEASRDPRERLLEMYEKYSPKEMAKKKREVTADMLVDWLSDPKADFNFRKRVTEALKKGSRLLEDPDLSKDIKRGAGTNRGNFFRTKVVPLIKEKDDRNTRTLASSLLKDMFGRVASVEPIFNYNADDKGTWNDAYNGWRKYLRKK